jgi:diguanylate cyclase (GGDEF)-like protein/PAS domain S-box-containing protein
MKHVYHLQRALHRLDERLRAVTGADEVDRIAHFELFSAVLTAAATPALLLAALVSPLAVPWLALGSLPLLPLYAVGVSACFLVRPVLLTRIPLRASLLALQLLVISAQVWAYDTPRGPAWTGCLVGVLVAVSRWPRPGLLVSAAWFTALCLGYELGASGLRGGVLAQEVTRELLITLLVAAVLAFAFRQLETIRRHLRDANTALHASTAYLRAVVEYMSEAILILGDDDVVRSANHAAAELFCAAEAALIGRPVAELLPRYDMSVPTLVRLATEQEPAARDMTAVRPGGQSIPVEVNTSLIVTHDGAVRILALRDTSAIRAQIASLTHRALHDDLTGLPNRVRLWDRLQARVADACSRGLSFSVLMLDLDGFKAVNDELGHRAGDRLLQLAAARLRGALRETDLVARIGGDEFAVLPGSDTGTGAAPQIAEKIAGAFGEPFSLDGRSVALGISVGIAHFPEHGEDAEVLLYRADSAMYAAKRAHAGWSVYAGAGTGRQAS